MSTQRILLVEDEQVTSMDLREMIEELGYTVSATRASSQEALDFLQENSVDLVFMDINIAGDKDGIEVARIIRDRHKIPFVYLTAFSDNETLNRARETEPEGFMVKPVTQADLNATLRMIFESDKSTTRK